MQTTIKTIIVKAVGNLDPDALSHHDLKNLSDGQIDELLKLVDQTVIHEMKYAASTIGDTPLDEIVDYAAEHSRMLLKYLAIRAILCGQEPQDDDDDVFDDLGDISIF